jgi:hypothetical protein
MDRWRVKKYNVRITNLADIYASIGVKDRLESTQKAEDTLVKLDDEWWTKDPQIYEKQENSSSRLCCILCGHSMLVGF